MTARVLVFLAVSTALLAQSEIVGAGHWEGSLKVPRREMKLSVDLARIGGEWTGTLNLPDQNIKNLPLANIRVERNLVTFELSGIPGNPTFDGEVSPGGDILAGDFGGGGGSVSCELKWVSEPKIIAAPKNLPVGKEFEGSWEGILTNPDGNRTRTVLTLQNAASGSTGNITVPEMGGQSLPVAGIKQEGGRIRFEVTLLGAEYTGELAGDYITGTWSQGNARLPLRFSRAEKK